MERRRANLSCHFADHVVAQAPGSAEDPLAGLDEHVAPHPIASGRTPAPHRLVVADGPDCVML
jgi:hypothetical protein